MDCIFCKIIAGEIPSKKVYEDDDVVAFYDIHPEAPVHVLVVPKHHVEGIQDLSEESYRVLKPVHQAIQKVAKMTGIDKTGYRVIANCGPGAGQTVLHLHYHVLGGKDLGVKLL